MRSCHSGGALPNVHLWFSEASLRIRAMVSSLINIVMTLLVAATAYSAAGLPAAADSNGTCMDNRSVQALIARHAIKTWPAIKVLAGISDKYKEVSAVRVCQEDGTPYYVVNVAGPAGESKQLILNAVDGSQ